MSKIASHLQVSAGHWGRSSRAPKAHRETKASMRFQINEKNLVSRDWCWRYVKWQKEQVFSFRHTRTLERQLCIGLLPFHNMTLATTLVFGTDQKRSVLGKEMVLLLCNHPWFVVSCLCPDTLKPGRFIHFICWGLPATGATGQYVEMWDVQV